MSFSFYVEPQEVLTDRQAHTLVVGLGSDGDLELAYIGMGDNIRHDGDVELTKEQLAQFIQSLSEIYTVMNMEES